MPKGRRRMGPNLKAADEVMPSQQLKCNGPQSMVISCPVQGKDIKAPEVQVLWGSNRLGERRPGGSQQQRRGRSPGYSVLGSSKQGGGGLGFFLPRHRSVTQRGRSLRNMRTILKRESKNDPLNRVWESPPHPNLFLFPGSPGSP